MHEWGLSRRLLEFVENEARARRLTRVSRIRLETAVLHAAEREALRFNFHAAAQGTVAQDAELDIEIRPARALCPGCLAEVEITQADQTCPHCGAQALTPLDGEVLRITELVAT